ncbi:MAG: deoxyribodipyrimidine photo-lyase [Candidatus Altiarchaeota archaeon]|nr:deoxyribodipyrimidine photo-lyase [Candidatus Altiarchaeota archaeon]
MKHKKALFVFRRDLRLEDNTGLIEAMSSSTEVLPCFIFDPRQIEDNRYRSNNALQFMLESLQDLERQLKEAEGRLYFFHGKPEDVVEKLDTIDAVYVNRDYTPFSKERDDAIRSICERKNVQFRQSGDSLLNEPEAVLKKDGKPYTVFTPYLRKAINLEVRKPQENKYRNYCTEDLPFEEENKVYERDKSIKVHGGRTNALRILQDLGEYEDYDDERNYPSLDATTHLSAHNKFGTCSIREVYHAIKGKLGGIHALLTELYWRDFFTQIGFYFPHIFGGAFKGGYDNVKWSYDKEKFRLWCNGLTGFPIVDAGMRELNSTGFMHNRVRMITSSFLTKDLHIDWLWGERYFAQNLVDYDPCVNNGNWQWASSTGCDSQPYFRVFNPWLQQKKYDPECGYIKKWIPELKDLTAEGIHNLHEKRPPTEYPKPIVDHSIESRKAKNMFKKAR